MKSATYRDLAWDGLAGVVREAAGAADMRQELEAALVRFRARFDAAVDAVPAVARALDRPADETQQSDERTVDPINRADEIAAHISETFNKK
jgi:hypothetical protein